MLALPCLSVLQERAESYCLGRITLCYEATPDDEGELGLVVSSSEREGESLGFHVCHAEPILTSSDEPQ